MSDLGVITSSNLSNYRLLYGTNTLRTGALEFRQFLAVFFFDLHGFFNHMAVSMGGDDRDSSGKHRQDASDSVGRAAAAVQPVPCSSAAKRFLIRLDNGSLICDSSRSATNGKGPCGVLLLPPEKLESLGRVNHSDLLRAYRVLVDLRRGSNAEATTTATERQTVENGGPPSKRARTDAGHVIGDVRRPASPTATFMSGDLPIPADWIDRCRDMLQSLREHLGNALSIFNAPVDPLVVTDYYKVVKNPMDLGTIAQKVDNSRYLKPSDFCADVRQVWYNCKLYNKKGDFVERTGTAASLHFEKLWSSSGLAESKDRSRRSNAGLAAAKFEPPPHNPGGKRMTKSGGFGFDHAKSSRKGSKSKGGGASSKKAVAPPMTREQMAGLAEKLSQMDEDALQPVVNIIRERTHLESGPDDEIELDIESLDNHTLWELDAYLKSVNGIAPVASGAAWAGRDDDSGTDSDSSTESDSD